MKNLFRRMKSSGSLKGEDAREEDKGERAKSPFGDEHGHMIPEMREQGGGLGWDEKEGEEDEFEKKEERGWEGGNAY